MIRNFPLHYTHSHYPPPSKQNVKTPTQTGIVVDELMGAYKPQQGNAKVPNATLKSSQDSSSCPFLLFSLLPSVFASRTADQQRCPLGHLLNDIQKTKLVLDTEEAQKYCHTETK